MSEKCFFIELVLVLYFGTVAYGASVNDSNDTCYCQLENAMLHYEVNKDNIQETFNPSNFASPDSVYVYYILNASSLPDLCLDSTFWALNLPKDPNEYFSNITEGTRIEMMIWTRTPIFALIPPFAAAEFGLSSFPLSLKYSPFQYRTTVCILLENTTESCAYDIKRKYLEQLTVKLSLYSVQYKQICTQDTNSVSYSLGENIERDSPSRIVAQLLYGAIILLSMAYIPVSLRYEQIVYDHVVTVVKRKLSISYSFTWGFILGCVLINISFFIPKGILSLVYILQHPYLMEPWEDRNHQARSWFISYILLYIFIPLVSQFLVALDLKKESDIPYPRFIDVVVSLCTCRLAKPELRGRIVQILAVWTVGSFCHFVVLSMPFTILEIAASPMSNLSWPSFLIFSFLGGCCLISIIVTVDRMWHRRGKTKTNCKETFYLCLYYLACFTISLVLAILMLVLCSMTVLDKVQTKPGVTNMISFLIAPLLVAVIGWLTKLGMQHVQKNLDDKRERQKQEGEMHDLVEMDE